MSVLRNTKRRNLRILSENLNKINKLHRFPVLGTVEFFVVGYYRKEQTITLSFIPLYHPHTAHGYPFSHFAKENALHNEARLELK